MLTDTNIYGLIALLKKLEARNLKWDYDYNYDCGVIEVFDRNFKFSRSGIKTLARYINTYDMMVEKADAGEYIFSDKVIKKHMNKLITTGKYKEVTKEYLEKKQQEKTVDGTVRAPKGYNDMIKTTLADLKEKCGFRDELMKKLFKVLEQDFEDLLNSDSDDVSAAPPCPPLDEVDRGM